DVVFALSASHIAAGLAKHIPVVHCSDATFASLVNYHGEFSHLSARTVKAGNELERRAINRSRVVLLASDIAKESARSDYGRLDGVHVVPFGANLDVLPVEDIWSR